jgi:uncharacterized membrane protein (DUF106 family)
MMEWVIKNGAKLATGIGVATMTTALREMLTPDNASKAAKGAIFVTDVIITCMVVDMAGDYIDAEVDSMKKTIKEVKETIKKVKEKKENPVEQETEIIEVEAEEVEEKVIEEAIEEKPKKARKTK